MGNIKSAKKKAVKVTSREVYLVTFDVDDTDPTVEFATLAAATKFLEAIFAGTTPKELKDMGYYAEEVARSSVKLYKARLIGKPKITFEL